MHRLACHHCGHVMPPPKACPECGEEDSLVACGPGVERIADEVADAVPRGAHRDRHLRHHLVAGRAPPSSSRAMEAGEIDIVVGTQLVTKGYHFPNLTLVGVVDADLGLQGGDLRAAERSFQQIQQVAGRAGRGDKPGRVLVQTHDPDAPVIAALVVGRRAGLLRRRDRGPARGGDAAVRPARRDHRLERGPGRGGGGRAAHRPRRAARSRAWRCSAPPPPRWPCCAAATASACWSTPRASLDVQDVIRDWLGALDWSAKVRVAVDVDPYSFL